MLNHPQTHKQAINNHMEYYIKTYFAVIKQLNISHVEYFVLYYIYYMSGLSKSGWAIVSDKKMAEELVVSRITIIRTLSNLLKAGYIIHDDNHINGTVRRRKVSDVFADAIDAASMKSKGQVKPLADDKNPKDPPVIPTKDAGAERTDIPKLPQLPKSKYFKKC